MKSLFVLGIATSLVTALLAAGFAQDYLPDLAIDHPAIRYFQQTPNDPIARLAARINRGEVRLERRGEGLGYLPSLLQQLGIRIDSQALVFSKTSFQAAKISPRNPRAIYFNDDVAIAFVRGSDQIEIIAVDPSLGPVFYTSNITDPEGPEFVRGQVCLKCHQGPATSGVPGLFVGSVFPSSSGAPFRGQSAIITDHRTAFVDRWGGWYVNAKSGQQDDRANAVASNPAEPELLDKEERNRIQLYGKIDPAGYLAPVSDIVALMTFEHQTQMMNYITRVGWEARMGELTRLDSDIDALIAYMLFAQEAPIREPIEGVSTFTKTFPQRGPRDRRGRSLRDFDLQTRLFRYPLSYMIYSDAFDALPDAARAKVYRRLYDVLTREDRSDKFDNLSTNDRRAILEILGDTKPDLPDYWQ
jgi:hypothetical protein